MKGLLHVESVLGTGVVICNVQSLLLPLSRSLLTHHPSLFEVSLVAQNHNRIVFFVSHNTVGEKQVPPSLYTLEGLCRSLLTF